MSYEEVVAIVAKVDAGLPVTREEAELVVRSVQRACKGPYKSEKHKAEYQELRNAAGGFGGQERGYDIGVLDALNRIHCGADFNDEIVKFPFDGKEHIVNCPKCGQEISFRSPFFVLSD